MDFEKYPEWNPFITTINGNPQVGSFLKANIGGIKFQPEVLAHEQKKEFRWKGKLLLKGLFDGEHQFKLKEEKGSVHFEQNEFFSGILVGLFSKKLDTDTKSGFIAMNEALKKRAENS